MDKEIKIECKLCNGSGWVEQRDKDGNIIYDLTGNPRERPCNCNKVNLWLKKLNKKHLYERFIKSKFKTFKDDTEELKKAKNMAIRYSKDFKNKNLILSGKSGTGKTHLAYAVLSEIIKNEYMNNDFITPEIVFYNDLIKGIEKAKKFTNKTNIEDIVNELEKPNVLLIDDFFKIKINDDILSVLFDVINARTYEDNKSTIITTEKSIVALDEIDGALLSRLLEKANYERNQKYIINLHTSNNYRL